MTNTHFHDDHEMIVKNRAYSYAPAAGGFRLAALNYANVGATSLFTTAEDLAKWIQNFDDGKIGGMKVIEQMYEQGVLNNGKKISYAFGLDIGKYRGLNRVAHSGGDAGYRSHVAWFPEQKFGVVVLSNLANFNPVRLALQVADIYLADKLAPEEAKASPVEKPAVKLDPAILDAHVGKYQIETGIVVDISKENDRLFAQPAGGARLELSPESETKFLQRANNLEITFGVKENGKTSSFVVREGNNDRLAKRIEAEPLKPADLAQYAGDYYSDELGTTYSLVVENEQLVARHRRHEDIKLTGILRDSFLGNRWFFQRVQFTRDNENRITGFRLSGGRVRNMRFDKRM
jgi:hypothetical protein